MEHATDGEPRAKSRLQLENLFDENGEKFNGTEEELIPLLQSVQRELGYLPEETLREIAHLTGLSTAKVFGTATFYSQFRFKPTGKYLVKVCRGTACHVRGGSRIQTEAEKQLGIVPGESTHDLKFSLETVACIGACAQAPTMVVGNEAYGKMTVKRVEEILKQRE